MSLRGKTSSDGYDRHDGSRLAATRYVLLCQDGRDLPRLVAFGCAKTRFDKTSFDSGTITQSEPHPRFFAPYFELLPTHATFGLGHHPLRAIPRLAVSQEGAKVEMD